MRGVELASSLWNDLVLPQGFGEVRGVELASSLWNDLVLLQGFGEGS